MGVAKSVEVQVVERDSAVEVFLDESERGGLDPARDPEATGDAFDEVGLAGA